MEISHATFSVVALSCALAASLPDGLLRMSNPINSHEPATAVVQHRAARLDTVRYVINLIGLSDRESRDVRVAVRVGAEAAQAIMWEVDAAHAPRMAYAVLEIRRDGGGDNVDGFVAPKDSLERPCIRRNVATSGRPVVVGAFVTLQAMKLVQCVRARLSRQ